MGALQASLLLQAGLVWVEVPTGPCSVLVPWVPLCTHS